MNAETLFPTHDGKHKCWKTGEFVGLLEGTNFQVIFFSDTRVHWTQVFKFMQAWPLEEGNFTKMPLSFSLEPACSLAVAWCWPLGGFASEKAKIWGIQMPAALGVSRWGVWVGSELWSWVWGCQVSGKGRSREHNLLGLSLHQIQHQGRVRGEDFAFMRLCKGWVLAGKGQARRQVIDDLIYLVFLLMHLKRACDELRHPVPCPTWSDHRKCPSRGSARALGKGCTSGSLGEDVCVCCTPTNWKNTSN